MTFDKSEKSAVTGSAVQDSSIEQLLVLVPPARHSYSITLSGIAKQIRRKLILGGVFSLGIFVVSYPPPPPLLPTHNY